MPDALDSPSYAQARELPGAGAPVTSREILHGYKIEARVIHPNARVEVGPGILLDNAWRVLPLGSGAAAPPPDAPRTGSVVVPISNKSLEMLKHNILPYAAAQAHRWGFHSAVEAQDNGVSDLLESRLVLVTFKQSVEIVEVGVTDGVTSYDDELNQIPLHERSSNVLPKDEMDDAPQPADDGEAAELVDAVPAELLSGMEEGRPADPEDAAADLAEEPAPAVKPKSRPKVNPAPKKKKKG